MPLQDLSNVTRTLEDLIEQNVAAIGGGSVSVSAAAPEKVGSELNTLSLHLYHVAEEASYRNLPGAGDDVPNVAKNPLALCLYYILTAHHDSSDVDLDPLTQQNMMGLAIKTLHDFPVITDDTVVNGSATPVLHPNLLGRNNHLQIIMRPTSAEDTVSFWATEDQQTARLSAYYEVRVVLLDAEEPKTMPGIVLTLGTYLVDMGTPQLECTRSLVSFPLPGSTGISDPQRIEATPARAATDPGDPVFPSNRLELLGSNLSIGRSRSLLLKNALWKLQTEEPVVVNPAINPSWNFDFRSDRVVVEINTALTLNDGTILTVFPGIYSVAMRVVKDEEVVLGQLKQIVDVSNDIVFYVTPRVAGHAAPGADTRITVNVVGPFDLTHGAATEEALEIQIVVSGKVYERGFRAVVLGDEPLNNGRFEITGANSISLQPDFDVTVFGEHPLRLIVNGAESQPFWIEIP